MGIGLELGSGFRVGVVAMAGVGVRIMVSSSSSRVVYKTLSHKTETRPRR